MKSTPQITSFFTPPTLSQWQEAAEAALKGRPLASLTKTDFDQIPIKPLYGPEDQRPGAPEPGQFPYTRGLNPQGHGPLKVALELGGMGLDAARSALMEALNQGVPRIWLNLAPSEGVPVSDSQDFSSLLEKVDLSAVELAIQCGGRSAEVLSWLETQAQRGDWSQWNLELLGEPVFDALAGGPDDLAAGYDHLALMISRELPQGIRCLGIDGAHLAHAGASNVQQLAFTLAAAAELFRQLMQRGLAPTQIARHLSLYLGLDTEFFSQIAKVRALRLIWGNFARALEIPAALPLHLSSSQWNKSRFDPHSNLLRSSTEALAASVAGADSFAPAAFDALGGGSSFGRRIAKNILMLTKEESGLDQVIDPAGGSWLVEDLSEKQAQGAWELFQQVEAGGGLAQWATSGKLQQEVQERAEEQKQAVESQKRVLVGGNSFADPKDEPLKSPGWSPPPSGAITPLPRRRVLEGFEALRERMLEDPPKVALLVLGQPKDYQARLDFASHFFWPAAAQTQVFSDPGEAARFGAVTLLCSSDALYQEQALSALKAASAANPNSILALAGNGGEQVEALKQAGVAHFITKKTAHLELLNQLFLR